MKALSSSPKGRSFLLELQRRARPEETLGLLNSLQRIETTIEGVRSQLQPGLIAGELQHVAMALDIALDGVNSDAEGDETARRFALVQRASRELATLSACLGVDDVASTEEQPAQRRLGDASAR